VPAMPPPMVPRPMNAIRFMSVRSL
jgi:hypothetical protein